MVQLTQHLLDGLAERMFKLYEMGMDPEAIATLFKFMFVSSRCRDSVLRQFGKMKEVVFGSQLFDRSPKTEFYRRSKQESKENRYPMPFEVKSCFVRYLIDYGQLRVKRITFEGGVVKEMCSRDVLPVELLGQMCSIDILSELLGFEDEGPGLPRSQQSDLQLDGVSVSFDREESLSKLANLNRFIALKPKELTIRLHWYDPPTETMDTAVESLCCPHVETVHVTQRIPMYKLPRLDFHTISWCKFLRYLSVSCRKLCLLDVQVFLCGDVWRELSDLIETAVGALRDEIFPILATTMMLDSRLHFDMRGALPLEEMNRIRDPTIVSGSMDVERQEGAPWRISFCIEAYDWDKSDGDEDDEEEDEGDGDDHHDCYSD